MSVDDAAMCLTHDIKAAWNYKLKLSVLFFDISGYFNNIHHDKLLWLLAIKDIPWPIIRWLASFLTN